MNKISALVLTKNEEDNIARCLDSLKFLDEVLVVDSGSTDQTLFIAAEYPNVKVIQTEWEGFAKTKQKNLVHARNEWILWVDADEELTAELQTEVQSIKLENEKDVFSVCRQNFFMGEKIKFSGWQNDWVVRLFNRKETRFNQKHVHEKLEHTGNINKFSAKLNHYTYKDLKTYLQKMDHYTTLGARDRQHKKKACVHQLITKPVSRFIRHYIFQLGLLDGKVGVIIALLSGYSVFLRLLKTMRLQAGEVS